MRDGGYSNLGNVYKGVVGCWVDRLGGSKGVCVLGVEREDEGRMNECG